MLIRFLAGMAALLVPALLVVLAIVCWAVIRRPAFRYIAVGICAVLLFGNVAWLLVGKVAAGGRENQFASLCARYTTPEVLGMRANVPMLLADYDWAAFRTDPAAQYAGTFYPTHMLQRFLFAPFSPYEAHAARVGAVFELVRVSELGDREEKRQREMPEAPVGYHWEPNSLGNANIESFDLVVTDLRTNERLGVLHTFGTLDRAAALFPSMAIAATPGQFQHTRRCPSLEEAAKFLRSVAQP